jgi:flavin reductase (DIM6/NTAB) family NADH-FMN oxidoreductase RutF
VRRVDAVNRLSLTTGSDPVPEAKLIRGYQTEFYKFEKANLTPLAAETVAAPRASECPVQVEALVEHW